MDWREAVAIALPIGRALTAAHAAGIIHRDVKPGNILLDGNGSVKLTDFGIAKLLEQRTGAAATRTGFVLGTPGYMSPEQMTGSVVDFRTDIWSLGAVLYEAIANQRPVPGTAVNRDLAMCPPPLAAAIGRALERDPALRFPAMTDFVRALERISEQPRSKRVAVRFRRSAFVLASSALLFTAWFVSRPGRTQLAAFRADRVSKLTTGGKAIGAAISPDGRYVVYIIKDSGRNSIRVREIDTGADTERLAPSETIYSDPTFAPDSNSFFYLADERRELRMLYRIPVLEGAPSKTIEDVDSPIAISPDGAQIEFMRANAAGDSSLMIASIDGSHARTVAMRPAGRTFLFDGAAWSPDGRSLIAAGYESPGNAALFDIRVSDGAQKKLGQAGWRWIGRVNRALSGGSLVFPAAERGSNVLQIYELPPGARDPTAITNDLSSYLTASLAGTRLISIQQDMLAAIWITAARGARESRRITPPAGRYFQIAPGPDGSLYSQTGSARELNVWRFRADGSREQITKGPFIDASTAVSPDGKRLAFISNRSGGWHLWASDADGRFMRQLTHGEGTYSEPSFAADGSILVGETRAGAERILGLRSDGASAAPVLQRPARDPVVSPDGRLLACDLNDGGIWRTAVAEIESGSVIRIFPDIPLSAWLRWTPDSKGLAYTVTNDGKSAVLVKSVAKPNETSELKLTQSGEDVIFYFDFARDGRTVASVRGIAVSDLLLFESNGKAEQ